MDIQALNCVPQVFIVAKGITVCLMAQVGLGQHIWNLTEIQIEQYFKVRLTEYNTSSPAPC